MDWKTAATTAHEVMNFQLFKIAGASITLFTLVALAVVFLVTIQVSKGMQRAVAKGLERRNLEGQEGSIRVAQRLVHYMVMVFGAFIAMQSLGIDLGALVTAGAVFAVGVGLAMQSLAQNFVSGVILLLERSIKPGDVIDVEGRTLRVTEMGIRSTVCRGRDGEDVIVPNSLLVQSAVRNLTKADRMVRVRVPVGVSYDSDMAVVQRVLHKTADETSWRSKDVGVVLQLLAFGSSSVDWEVSVWADDPWRLPQLKSDLSVAVWDALKAAHITIAYPQMDVHFDPPAAEALRLVPEQD